MYLVTDAQYEKEVEPILRKVFVNDYPVGNPFSCNMAARKLLYRCETFLEESLLKALIEAASSVGDSGCYLSQLWIFNDDRNHCYIPLDELLEAYNDSPDNKKAIDIQLNINMFSEYVLYSSQGKWGLMVSHEHYGILGSSSEFMEKIKSILPDIDLQVDEFLKYIWLLKDYHVSRKLGGLRLKWLPELLNHIYGEETAKKMLEEKGLP